MLTLLGFTVFAPAGAIALLALVDTFRSEGR
jgi:hypothetical protein